MVKCFFNDVSERDMDLLFLEEFASSDDFVCLFSNLVNIERPRVLSVQQSKIDPILGESDMTVIVESGNEKIGFLIEDKIDAIAMSEQCNRYFQRGEKGIKEKDYDSFFVFIVAPEQYLSENKEAKKYPYHISYETVLRYFQQRTDLRSNFKAQQIEQAIYKQKHGYQVVEHRGVSEFWEKYIAYQKQNYNHLYFVSSGGKKGSDATWPRFNTRIKGLYMYHKSEFGFIDLTFNGAWEHVNVLEEVLRIKLGHFEDDGITLQKTGKSASLRIVVPILDFHKSFEEQFSNTEECFKAIEKMTNLSNRLTAEDILPLIKQH